MAKQPARLGELQPPQNGFFSINSHDGGCFKGLEDSTLKGIKRIERKEEEREAEGEERRGNEAEALPNHDRDQSPCHFLFCVLHATVG